MQLKKTFLAAAVLAVAVGPAFAQTSADLSADEWSSWHDWATHHKATYSQIRNKPDRAFNQKFIDRHQDLKDYYAAHPAYWTYVQGHHDWSKHDPSWDRDRTTGDIKDNQ